jgi:hypothetical protein
MIVLDTNIISAMMRATVDPVIVDWLSSRPRESIWVTAVTVFEIRFGLELLAAGRRRQQLETAFALALSEDLQGRVLPFDSAAANAAASLAAERQRRGRPVEVRDTQIAGIVMSKRAELATRNVRHFRDLGVAVVDPWSG